MKQCSQCKRELPLDAFDKQKTGKLGRRADCKECRKRFTRTKEGLVKALFSNQKAKSKKRGYQPPKYTEKELFNWMNQQQKFHTLYATWIKAGYPTKLKPSIDRIDDYKTYALDNIQVVTVDQNVTRYCKDTKKGINTKRCKAVDMLSLDGEYIRRYYSASEAARQFNGIPSNIIGACNHRVTKKKEKDGSIRLIPQLTAYGYKWRYSTIDNDNKEIL